MRILAVVSIISANLVWKLAATPALWTGIPVAFNPPGAAPARANSNPGPTDYESSAQSL